MISLTVGQTLQILGPCDEDAPDKLQWYRVISADKWQLISGATRNQVRMAAHWQVASLAKAGFMCQSDICCMVLKAQSKTFARSYYVLQYSPEPLDAGYALACCIHSHGSSPSSVARVASKAPVSHAPGVHTLLNK